MSKLINSLKNLTGNIKYIIRIAKKLFTEQPVNVFILIKNCFVNYFKYGIIGNSIRISASDICQLQCPACFQSQEGNKISKGCYLKFDDFKNFIYENPTFKNIELSYNGEIFLNPQLKDIIEYAYTKKINLTAGNGVNLNAVSEEMLECLVKYKFRVMVVSIDGTNNDYYQIYRRAGSFDRVIENIKRINYYKQKYNTLFPLLIWQFIIFGHNEGELSLAKDMAKKLNMRFSPKFNWDQSYSPVKDKEFIRKEVKYASRQEYEDRTESLYILPCRQLWLAPQIGPDGVLHGCCVNMSSDAFGNVFKSGLKTCMRNEKFIYAKKMLLGKKRARKDIPCFHCNIYKKVQPH